MQIPDKSIVETIDSVVSEFERLSSPEYSTTIESVRHFHTAALGMLRGIARLLPSLRYAQLIDEKINALTVICVCAEKRIAAQQTVGLQVAGYVCDPGTHSPDTACQYCETGTYEH
ncbi:hypothetical protein A1353_18870 [Methylomonas methanica]|uniref:Uncharacterized protein n=1 Tax=Methylomonas methanica TaxID=421 RepID=A0A177M5R1_METMH|nr:hypothetical protein [Methylomonas methanica]OAI00874.1 hypothetical protein A1353_18870 [Methylomonas methanica]